MVRSMQRRFVITPCLLYTSSKEMMEICGVKEEQLPKVYESWEVVGTLKPEVAKELGFSENVDVYKRQLWNFFGELYRNPVECSSVSAFDSFV